MCEVMSYIQAKGSVKVAEIYTHTHTHTHTHLNSAKQNVNDFNLALKGSNLLGVLL